MSRAESGFFNIVVKNWCDDGALRVFPMMTDAGIIPQSRRDRCPQLSAANGTAPTMRREGHRLAFSGKNTNFTGENFIFFSFDFALSPIDSALSPWYNSIIMGKCIPESWNHGKVW